jgi:hypothetical protein
MSDLGRFLIIAGLGIAAVGALLLFAPKLPLGRLPGDIVYKGPHTSFYFPIVTCLVLSAIFSLVMWLISLFRK